MTPEKSLRAIFDAALDRTDATERGRFLEEACGADAPLRARIEKLLRAHDEAGGFLSHPSQIKPGADGMGTAPAPTEKAGDCIGRYKLLQQIGEGGCGVVYMAAQEEPMRRQVALKIIKLGMDTKQVVARFEAERQALALMDHPNIARVLDAGATESGRPYFVMELVRGVKLTEFCDEKTLSPRERLELFMAVCSAVQHAHQKGVIHRDLKPSNILVTTIDGAPVPKVIDFGIAKATTNQRLTDRTLFTAFEQFIGTPAYMSPEQAEMSGVDIDTRSDIYSLGVVLYELLTGRTPFDTQALMRAGVDEIRRTIREREPPKPSTRLNTLSAVEATTVATARKTELPSLIKLVRGDLDWIVMKCLDKDRNRRYATANGLAADIRRHLDCVPVVARPPGRFYEFQKTVRRHKFGFAATAAVMLALAAGLGMATWTLAKERRALERVAAAEREQNRLREEAQRALTQAESGEAKARAEAAKSRQVAQSLKELLAGLGSSTVAGHDATIVKDVLDKAAARISSDLKNQPEVEAELHLTIGLAYWQFGQYAAAETSHRAALAIYQRLFGPESEPALTVLPRIAECVGAQGRRTEAETLARQAVAGWRKASAPDELALANSLHALAYSLLAKQTLNDLDAQRRLWAEAEDLEREVLTIQQRHFPGDSMEVVTARSRLAHVLGHHAYRQLATNSQAKIEEAITLFEQVIQTKRERFGDERGEMAASLQDLANVFRDSRDYARAESLAREALAIRRKTSTSDSPDLLYAVTHVSYAITGLKKFAEAEVLDREALAICKKMHPDDHPKVADVTDHLARMLHYQGKFDEAAAVYHEQLARAGKLSDHDLNTLQVRIRNFTTALHSQKKFAGSEALLKGLIPALRARPSVAQTNLADMLYRLTIPLKGQGKWAEVETVARGSLAIYEAESPDSLSTISVRAVLGQSLLHQDRHDQVRTLMLTNFNALEQLPDKTSVEFQTRFKETVQLLVRVCNAMGESTQAADWKAKLDASKEAGTTPSSTTPSQ